MLKAIIFDLDNTLIDFLKMKRVSCEAAVDAMRKAGLRVPRKTALDKIYEIYGKYGMEDQKVFQKLLNAFTGKVNYRILAHGIMAYRKVKEGFLMPYPGTRKTLIKLKKMGLRLAIVSDAPRIQALMRIVAMKLDRIFDTVVTFDDTKARKPSALPFRKALRALKVKPEECLMVGDVPERDIQGAKALGMVTCFAQYGSSGKAYAEFTINRIGELVEVVGKLMKD
jgi:putative hydrolase of the HAD superfamily